MVQFTELESQPTLLLISKPLPLITLIEPITSNGNNDVVMLQGPVQRLNVVFQCGSNDLRNGRVYLSSDSNPTSTSSALFWYPDTSSITSLSSLTDTNILDKVCFHPLVLNSSMQPLQPILLPDQEADSEFCVPLFLRSEVHGSFKIKLCIEYVPKSGLTLPVTKDFEINITFDRSVKMSYTMTPRNDAQCGVIKESSMAIVTRGDIINMAASLTCINSLNGHIELIGMALHTKPDDEDQINTNTNSDIFKSITGDSVCDLLKDLSVNDDNNDMIRLKKGEVFVGSTDIYCSEASNEMKGGGVDLSLAPPIENEHVNVSMGNLYVDWRIADNTLLLPYNNNSNDNNNNNNNDDDNNDTIPKFDWLYNLGSSGTRTGTESALDLEVVSTRVCGMVFVVSQVQVVDPPFKVNYNIPNVCTIGDTVNVDIEIKSKLWSYERLNMIIELSDDFIMTGFQY